MLDEMKGGKGGGAESEARYKAALDGRSLGTHSSGTTAGARAIRQQQPEAGAGAAAGGGKKG